MARLKTKTKEIRLEGVAPGVTSTVYWDGSGATLRLDFATQRERGDTEYCDYYEVMFRDLSIDELACVARTMSEAVLEAQVKAANHFASMKQNIREAIGG